MSELNAQLERVAQWSKTFKLLGDPTRLKLLCTIHFSGQHALSVSELAQKTSIRLPAASAALRALEAAGSVEAKRDGRNVLYAIANDHIHELLHWCGSGHDVSD